MNTEITHPSQLRHPSDDTCHVCGLAIFHTNPAGLGHWMYRDGTNKDHGASPLIPAPSKCEQSTIGQTTQEPKRDIAHPSFPAPRAGNSTHGVHVFTKGHKYILTGFESPEGNQTIQFIEKQLNPLAVEAGTLETVNDGTTNEAVLEMLIDRMGFLQSKFPCRENAIVITHLETALLFLEKRTRDRKARGAEGAAKA